MENKEEILLQIELSRERMHKAIDERYDEMITAIQTENASILKPLTLDLADPPHMFKGRKPAAVIYPDGEKVKITTWRNVALELLTACNNDAEWHQKLMDLRNKVSGRSRFILTDKPDGMDVPIRIDKDLYFEGKFDTEYLIKMLTENIFKRVGFPYELIEIEFKSYHQDVETSVESKPVKIIDPIQGKFGNKWVSYCYDAGIERENPQTEEREICEGYFCQVYSDKDFTNQTDYFCLAVGYEIENLSDDELNRGIMEYLGLKEDMEMKM